MKNVRLLPDPALRAQCTRHLSYHGAIDVRGWVERLAQSPELGLGLDNYSEGPAMQQLETEVAGLLGKAAALFFHKGVVAQQAAVLVHAAERNRRVVALHPKSHLALDEADALDRLAGLLPLRLGTEHAPFTVADLERVAEPLAAVTVEVPLRRAAFTATEWLDLEGIATWARERDTPFHLDGARIWEVQPWYGKTIAEIAALADTVYVSFYKGLGGMGGCVLAGPKRFIEAARPWRNRYGGDLPTIFPYVLTALDGLRRHLPRMAEYHRHAVAVAAALGGVGGLSVLPSPPHSNSFQVHFPASVDAMERAAIAHAKETGVWLFNRFAVGPYPTTSMGELVVGDATLAWSPAEVTATLAALRHRASEFRAAAE
jgi:threonine aldolase